MQGSRKFSTPCCLAALLLAIIPIACGGPKEADPDLARKALVTVLDAWHDGRSVDEASNISPSTTVADPDWQAGYKLAKYEVAGTTSSAGFDLMIPVELWLRDPKGKDVRHKVRYTVSLTPARTVLRAPL
ncbi:hypothetical protein [Singulisphaera sp. PoT]|uniref:hypothetical protein n=1 Tax=Singulisphaera sp. PoT TaxID=3411797 RepID=UPI003BF51A12